MRKRQSIRIGGLLKANEKVTRPRVGGVFIHQEEEMFLSSCRALPALDWLLTGSLGSLPGLRY